MNDLEQQFGKIDIYLFDQLLKGTFDNCRQILDVGCGSGRNIIYFLKQGYKVYGIDPNPAAIEFVRQMSMDLAPGNNIENFKVALAEDMPFQDASFDLIICSAVLHFARNEEHFDKMIKSIWMVLKPGGFLFARLASDIGIEKLVEPKGGRIFHLPDGTERFLVNEQMLIKYTQNLEGHLFEPIKTTNVQNLRCMTTWCIKKK